MQKIAVITGASRGIGLAMGRALAREGWTVCGLRPAPPRRQMGWSL